MGEGQLSQREEIEALRKEKEEIARDRERSKQQLSAAGQEKQQFEAARQNLQEQIACNYLLLRLYSIFASTFLFLRILPFQNRKIA